MATQGTPSGKSFVFDIKSPTIRAGGGERTTPEDTFSYAESEAAYGIASAAASRKEEMDRLTIKNTIKQQEQEDAAEIAMQKIALLRPDSMNFQHDYSKLMGDKMIHRGMLGGGRQAIQAMMGQKLQEHGDHMQSWKDIAKNHAYTGDVTKLPLDEEGVVDWEKTQPMFERSLSEHTKKVKSDIESAMRQQKAAGVQQVPVIDPQTGEMTMKLQKLPETAESMMGGGEKPLPQEDEGATNKRPPITSFE